MYLQPAHTHSTRFMQTDINENMRAILIDWLVEVHYKFKVSSCHELAQCQFARLLHCLQICLFYWRSSV